jgi:hypothetical protein
MNFFVKKPREASPSQPRTSSGRPQAVWTRDPKTGRLVQTWRSADDGERSCTVRSSGPRHFGWTSGLKKAA